MDINDLMSKCEKDMSTKIEKLRSEFNSLRTGRANPQLLDTVYIEYYGSKVPLKQIAAITVPDARTLEIKPWDRTALEAIENELKKVDLGSVPQRQGDIIRINLPPMNEEQRKKLVKVVSQIAEEIRVEIRNIRRDYIERIKKAQKSSEISEDDAKRYELQIQKLTDKYIDSVNQISQMKEKDLLTV
ncbi:MAG: ribosome recycling factor [Elusimicrobiales bacterium]|nr:ribosome recycling factor [Elusimicrobiales bacterium]